MKLPEREYYTLPELAERWKTTERHVLEMILNLHLDAVALVAVDAKARWVDDHKDVHEQSGKHLLTIKTWHHPELLFDLYTTGRGVLELYADTERYYVTSDGIEITADQLLVTNSALADFEQSNQSDSMNAPAELGTNERKTLLRMILGMAMRKYGYDPKAERNEATGTNNRSIAFDLERAGFPTDRQTIKKYLDAAAEELLPRDH